MSPYLGSFVPRASFTGTTLATEDSSSASLSKEFGGDLHKAKAKAQKYHKKQHGIYVRETKEVNLVIGPRCLRQIHAKMLKQNECC